MILTLAQLVELSQLRPAPQAQFIFTHAATHLLTQNRKSVASRERLYEEDIDFECKYRGPNDCACAIGALIPNELYSAHFEGLAVRNLVMARETGELWDTTMEKHTELLTELQRVHDRYEPGQWRERLTDLAEEYDLEMPREN